MSGATGDEGILGLPAEADVSDVAARLRALDARLGRLFSDYMLKVPAQFGSEPAIGRAIADLGADVLATAAGQGKPAAVLLLEAELAAIGNPIDGEEVAVRSAGDRIVAPTSNPVGSMVVKDEQRVGGEPKRRSAEVLAALRELDLRGAWGSSLASERYLAAIAILATLVALSLWLRQPRWYEDYDGIPIRSGSITFMMDGKQQTALLGKELSAGLIELEGLDKAYYLLEVRNFRGEVVSTSYICRVEQEGIQINGETRRPTALGRPLIAGEKTLFVPNFALHCTPSQLPRLGRNPVWTKSP